MQFGHRTFTIADPKGFDGNPFEVAERAVGQLAGVATLLTESLPEAAVMARNAALERQLQRREDPSPDAWEQSAEGAKFAAVQADAARLAKSLAVLRRASGYDPKNPPRA